MKLRYFLAIITLLLAGCDDSYRTVVIELRSVDNLGVVIPEAAVTINGKLEGSTSAQGDFKKELDLPLDHRNVIEVVKKTDSNYFAPFYKSFTISPDSEDRILNISAVLYRVPKPTDTDAKPKAPEPKVDIPEEKGPIKSEEPAVTENTKPQDSEPLPTPEHVSPLSVPKTPTSKTPKPNPSLDAERLFTFHTYSKRTPISGVDIFYSDAEHPTFTKLCQTNKRGRCTFKWKALDNNSISVLASKKGYQSSRFKTRITQKGQLRIQMNRGESIDIFTFSSRLHHRRGMPDVAVYIEGKHVGTTDRLGHFSHIHTGPKEDLVEVELRNENGFPKIFKTDLIIGGPMSITKHYTSAVPEPIVVVLNKAKIAGNLNKVPDTVLSGEFDRLLDSATAEAFFKSSIFERVPRELLIKNLKSEENLRMMISRGWEESEIRLDGILQPTVIIDKEISIELAFIGRAGTVIAAAKAPLKEISKPELLSGTLLNIRKKIVAKFPFEGTVISKTGDYVRINLGSASGRAIKNGDKFDIWGMQIGSKGLTREYMKVATALADRVTADYVRANLVSYEPRSVVQVGDLAVVRRQSVSDHKIQILVKSKSSENDTRPVQQANIYFKGDWIGATDATGLAQISKAGLEGVGILKVVKPGYSDFVKELRLNNKSIINIPLSQETHILKIDSIPTASDVMVDGVVIGKTPFKGVVPSNSKFVKLGIKGPSRFKEFEQVLELDDGTLDLTGQLAIRLEVDILGEIMALVKAERYKEAVAQLGIFPADHSDYFASQHLLGNILLENLKQPTDATEAYKKLTQVKSIASFQDKRFISSHVNLGLALFQSAEEVKGSDNDKATNFYTEAAERLQLVEPYLRHLPNDQHIDALNKVYYYMALIYQQLWEISSDNSHLNLANKAWEKYLSNKEIISEKTNSGFVQHAKVYQRQIAKAMQRL